MASKVISFRLNEAEIQALEALQTEADASINQTAVRVLRQHLNISNPVNKPVDISQLIKKEIENTLNTQQNRENWQLSVLSTLINIDQIKQEIENNFTSKLEEQKAQLTASINQLKQEINEQLGEFAA
ncbi:MAG TPA: hypothetical protein VK203_31480 [Nostocaceae cyanobacterium]|nr:hypothetical protein [Nostocaceae cyanobacterium]